MTDDDQLIGVYVGIMMNTIELMPRELRIGYEGYLKEVYAVESLSEALMLEAKDIRKSMERIGL